MFYHKLLTPHRLHRKIYLYLLSSNSLFIRSVVINPIRHNSGFAYRKLHPESGIPTPSLMLKQPLTPPRFTLPKSCPLHRNLNPPATHDATQSRRSQTGEGHNTT
jgi:hypothetical protein